MKKILIPALLFAVLFSSLSSFAQAKAITINGRITSFEESLPLEGVSIQVKNSNNSTGTQPDGSFSLAIQPGEKALLVKLDGYETKEIPITKSREYNVVLKRAGNIVYGAGLNAPVSAAPVPNGP